MTDAFVGIDVSESGLALAVHQSDYRFECVFDPSTASKLISELQRLQPKLIALAAGRNGADIPLVAALHCAGLPTIVVDEPSVRRFAASESLDGDNAQQLAGFAANSRHE